MVNPSKANALNRKANAASITMKECAKKMQEAIVAQCPPTPPTPLASFLPGEPDLKFEVRFTRKELERMMSELLIYADGIDKHLWKSS